VDFVRSAVEAEAQLNTCSTCDMVACGFKVCRYDSQSLEVPAAGNQDRMAALSFVDNSKIKRRTVT
jgi:hypothetical protein